MGWDGFGQALSASAWVTGEAFDGRGRSQNDAGIAQAAPDDDLGAGFPIRILDLSCNEARGLRQDGGFPAIDAEGEMVGGDSEPGAGGGEDGDFKDQVVRDGEG